MFYQYHHLFSHAHGMSQAQKNLQQETTDTLHIFEIK